MEVTDGWYSTRATLDSGLSRLLAENKLGIGTCSSRASLHPYNNFVLEGMHMQSRIYSVVPTACVDGSDTVMRVADSST